MIVFWLETDDVESSTRTIKARKIGQAGETLWAADTIIASDHQLPSYLDLTVEPDSAGGAFVAWVEAEGLQLFSLVQHVSSDGSMTMTPSGVLLSLSETTSHFDPHLAYLPSMQELMATWEESDIDQTVAGIYAQRFSLTGDRGWGDNGLPLAELSPNPLALVGVRANGGDIAVFFFEAPAKDAETSRAFASRVALQTPAWSPTVLSDVLSIKEHAAVSDHAGSGWWTVWSDQRSDEGDIYAAMLR